MEVQDQVLDVLDEVLSLGGRTARFSRDTRLLGAVPEFDSMAVVSVISALEERFAIEFDDDDIDAAAFATIGSLVDLVQDRVTS